MSQGPWGDTESSQPSVELPPPCEGEIPPACKSTFKRGNKQQTRNPSVLLAFVGLALLVGLALTYFGVRKVINCFSAPYAVAHSRKIGLPEVTTAPAPAVSTLPVSR